MKTDTIVQFLRFETTYAAEEFKTQWEASNKLVTGKPSITLQQEVDKKGMNRYLLQYRFNEDDIDFNFKKEKRSAHETGVEIRVKPVGGYSTLQMECDHDSAADDCKIFVFLNSEPELVLYKELVSYHFLNIYQAYYESSAYTYILEFFTDNKQTDSFIEQLKLLDRVAEIGIYKEYGETKSNSSKKHLVKN
jgi:O-acetylhomoserine/O-acetylserine sulfhydrylase-like pyridoxal-dependent enzyme